jgi:hypothetical protein
MDMIGTSAERLPHAPWSTGTVVRLLRWVAVRLVVAVLCVAVLLAVAQFTVHELLAYYIDIPPYASVG